MRMKIVGVLGVLTLVMVSASLTAKAAVVSARGGGDWIASDVNDEPAANWYPYVENSMKRKIGEELSGSAPPMPPTYDRIETFKRRDGKLIGIGFGNGYDIPKHIYLLDDSVADLPLQKTDRYLEGRVIIGGADVQQAWRNPKIQSALVGAGVKLFPAFIINNAPFKRYRNRNTGAIIPVYDATGGLPDSIFSFPPKFTLPKKIDLDDVLFLKHYYGGLTANGDWKFDMTK